MADHPHDLTAHRVAQNQATFRAANEDIEAAAEAMAPDLPRVPYICECPETACTRTMRLSRAEYELIRSDPTHFVVIPGHEVCEVDGEHVARIIGREADHTIMEKVGAAGEEARRLDRRTDSDSDSASRPKVAEADA
jgi:hypothetical protein